MKLILKNEETGAEKVLSNVIETNLNLVDSDLYVKIKTPAQKIAQSIAIPFEDGSFEYEEQEYDTFIVEPDLAEPNKNNAKDLKEFIRCITMLNGTHAKASVEAGQPSLTLYGKNNKYLMLVYDDQQARFILDAHGIKVTNG